MLPHPKICILPWISVETTPTGTIRPCCLSFDEVTHQGQPVTVADGLTAAYRSDSMQQLRQDFLDAKRPASCQRCWAEEDAGRTSKRQWHIRKFAKHTAEVDWYNKLPNHLWLLDLKLGNICNLKCRICGTWSSSKWAQEEIQYQTISSPKETRAYMQLKQGEWPRKSPTFWEDLKTLLPHIKYFEFTGGEPFLINEHIELLQLVVDLGYANDISIHYNTNGTVWNQALEKVWAPFKNVEIAFSIDNVGTRFEIERSGAKWNDVQENIEQAKRFRSRSPNITLQVCTTINIQNVYYLEDICKWIAVQNFNMVYINMLHDPLHMSIAYMTPAARDLVVDHLRCIEVDPRLKHEVEGVIRFIEQGPGSDGEKFCRFMKRTDHARNENFAETHKEIAEAMGYGS